MKRDYNPVDVELSIENPSIERGAFYRLCFITESNIAPRTLKVTRLQDLLENGYSRLDLAYNFCVGVFSQQGIDTVYIRAKRSSESYVEAYNSEDNSMYYFVVLQTKDLTEIKKFNSHLVSSDEMKLQFFSQNVGSKTLQSPKLVNYYQDYTCPEGGVSSDNRDFYLNSAYGCSIKQIKLSLPDYLLSGLGDIAIDYGIYSMTGRKQIWEIDKAGRRIKYAPEVLQQGWVGSQEESTVNGSDITVVAYKGSEGVSKKSTVLNPKVKIETISGELLKGLGKEVLDYAIPLIDPKAKNWVLDPANNRVKYSGVVVTPVLYRVSSETSSNHGETMDEACTNYLAAHSEAWSGGGITYGNPRVSPYGNSFRCVLSQYRDGKYIEAINRNIVAIDGKTETIEKYIPIDTVSQQVIANADSGHAPSKTFLKSIPLFSYILTGSGTEAVNKAVLDIDPEAKDWVLDSVNNRISYKIPANTIASYKYSVSDGGKRSEGDSEVDACNKFITTHLKATPTGVGALVVESSARAYFECYFNKGYNSKVTGIRVPFSETTPEQIKTIPISVVSSQVISNADAGHTPSQEALRLSTVERVNTGEYDEALEAASTEIDTSWKYLPIFDVAVQVKRNSIAGHAESIEAVNNSLPFVIPNYESYVTITGIAEVGEVLTATVTDKNGVPNSINHQWYASGEAISGATSKTYTLKTAQAGKVITVKAEYTDIDGYVESVTSVATEVVKPVEIVDEGVGLKDFDFAVVKYQWSEADGTDLDTRTWISSPDRSEHKVGWSRLTNDLSYLQWNEDNTGSGVESVLIDVKNIQKDFPSQKDIAIKMAAFWYSTISSGNVRLQFSLFKGGIMKNSSDFDWVNEGGREVQNITLSTNTQIVTSEDVNGQLLATLKFNTDTGAGSLTNPDGVIGVDNPVLPEIVPAGAPLKFTSESGSGVGELPIKLQLVNPVGDWFLATQGLPVASFNGVLAEGVTSTSSENGITLLLKNTHQDVMDYELLGHFESVTLSSGEVGATGEVSVTQFGEKVGKHLFSLTGIDLKVPTQLPESITSTNKMFSGSSDFDQDLTTWDVSNVTDMSYMFEGCTGFNALIGGWNVSNVTNMEGMFKDCEVFDTDISSWNTSTVINMSYMFNKAYNFAGNISNWNVSNVTNMAHMFEGTGYFNQDIKPWDVSNVTNMDYMFNSADEFNQDLSQWCVKRIPIAPVKFDTAPSWTATKPVWGTCPEKAPVVPEPTGEVFTFSAHNDYTDIAPIEVQVQDAVGNWAIREDGIVIATSDGYINNRFTLTSDDTSSYVTIPITEEVAKSYEVIGKMDEVKLSHKRLRSSYANVKILSFGEGVNSHKFNLPKTDLTVPSTLPSHVKSTQYMFQNCDEFNQDLSTWDVSNVTDMGYMFEGCIAFDMSLDTWNVSNVTNMEGMFKDCDDFNGSISSWNVSNVVNMSHMFKGCKYFNIAISNWKPLNAVTLAHMFDGCEAFDQLISKWKTPKAVDLSYMLAGCNIYNRAMGGWDVHNVTNMQGMFKDCDEFNKTLALWNVSNVSDMSHMFEGCETYNQDLSAWKPTEIKTKPVDFDKGADAWKRPQPTWGGE